MRANSAGATWESGPTPGTSIPLEQFHIAMPSQSAGTINTALQQGRHLLFTPGVYRLDGPINLARAGTIVLGLGYPTLTPVNGTAAMTVADVDGVRLGGLLFDAGTRNSPVLLRVGPSGSTAGHVANPTTLQDLFFRIGGAAAGSATTSLEVNSNDVIIDHIWAWRGDHGTGIGWTVNPADTGLIVNGRNVLAYGLFVEHYQKYEVIWNGENGRTIFFQNEMPYDPPNQTAWRAGALGYAAYKVAGNVTTHEAWGVGSYCYFRDDPTIVAAHGFEVPNVSGMKFHDLLTVSLGGNGTIAHVINDAGGPATGTATVPSYLAGYTGGGASPPVPLPRTGWSATASHNASMAGNMIDADHNNRWTSGVPMANGQWIQVEMAATRLVRMITMDSGGHAGDYARGYAVYLSPDGTSWGSPVATGTGSASLVTVSFTATNARHVRVVQTGSATSWWSIVEFDAYV